MPTLSNQRWEAFSRAVARGEPASRAYSNVYHVENHVAEAAASRLLRNVKVTGRVTELKVQAALRTEKTVASLVADLDDTIAFAKQCGNPAAVVQAIALQARLLGLEAPRQLEVMHKPAPLPTRVLELTEEEWSAQFSSPPYVVKAAKPLKQIRAEKRSPAPVFPEPVTGVSSATGVGWLDLNEELE